MEVSDKEYLREIRSGPGFNSHILVLFYASIPTSTNIGGAPVEFARQAPSRFDSICQLTLFNRSDQTRHVFPRLSKTRPEICLLRS